MTDPKTKIEPDLTEKKEEEKELTTSPELIKLKELKELLRETEKPGKPGCCECSINLRKDYSYLQVAPGWMQLWFWSMIIIALASAIIALYYYFTKYNNMVCLQSYTADVLTIISIQMVLLFHDVIVYYFDWLWLIFFPVTFVFFGWAFSYPLWVGVRLVRMYRLNDEMNKKKQRINELENHFNNIYSNNNSSDDNSRDLIVLSAKEQKDLVKPRPLIPEDRFPYIVRAVYRCSAFIIGFGTLFLIFLPIFFVIQIIGVIYSILRCCKFTDKARVVRDREYTPSDPKGKYCCCYFMRDFMGKCRIFLITRNYAPDSILSIFIGFYQLLEYFVYASTPWVYLNTLANTFGDYFPLVFGIGVAKRDSIIKLLHDKDIKKGPWFLFPTSDTMKNFATKYGITFLSSHDENYKLGRQIVHSWVSGFNFKLLSSLELNNDYLFTKICGPPPKEPSNKFNDTHSKYIAGCFGSIFFYLATEKPMDKDDRAAFQSLIFKPYHFFPAWWQFLLGGGFLERKQQAYYYRFRDHFAKNWQSPGFQSILKLNEEVNNVIDLSEACRLLVLAFVVAAAVAPSKMTAAIVKRIYSNPNKYIKLWKKSAKNFILESARLDKGVPTVCVRTNSESEYNIGGYQVRLPSDTPLLCCVQLANRDPAVFIDPDVFNPERDNLDQVITWNGLEKLIRNKDPTKRPPRYCPGHDSSFKVIEFLVNHFLPSNFDNDTDSDVKQEEKEDIKDDSILTFVDNYIQKHTGKFADVIHLIVFTNLDTYTKTLLIFMRKAATEHNANPPKAKDIIFPKITDADTEIIPLCGINLAKTDEDYHEDFGKVLGRKFMNWKRLGITDTNDEWKSIDAAMEYKKKYFSQMPPPNLEYEELSSDKMCSQLAFSSMACHYTKRVDNDNKDDNPNIPDNAEFVSDFSTLSKFKVKPGYEIYGAIAYFNNKYEAIGIYWCHKNKLILPNNDEWEHVKWVWRTTFFCYVTVVDHLYQTHLLKSNLLVISCVECLPPTHPLRIFLKPFIYRAVTINQQAFKSLIDEQGLVHRLWTFEYETLTEIFSFAKENYKFRILPDFVDKSMRNVDDNIFGFNKDVNEFWIVMRKYVESFLKIYYPNINDLFNDKNIVKFSNKLLLLLNITDKDYNNNCDKFIDVLTQLMCTVSGVHEHVGQVSDYAMGPKWVGARLRAQKEICSVQEYSQLLALVVMTGLKAPKLMGDWSHLIKKDKYEKENKLVYNQFKDDLSNLAVKVDERNRTRTYPTRSFNPIVMECSVSV